MAKCVLSVTLISQLFLGVRGILQLAQRDTLVTEKNFLCKHSCSA